MALLNISKYFGCLPHELLDIPFEYMQIDNLCMMLGLEIEEREIKKIKNGK